MAWNDAEEIFVGSDGQVYFAPVGTPLPKLGDDPTAKLNSAFSGAGFLTEDGVTPTFGTEVTEINSWQSDQPVRRNRQTQNYSFAFSMQQWNETNLLLAFGGGEVKDHGSGLFSYSFPESSDPLEEWSLVVDAQDGDVHQRFVVPRGNVTDDVSSAIKRTEESTLPITFKALKPSAGGSACYLLSDDPSFTVGS